MRNPRAPSADERGGEALPAIALLPSTVVTGARHCWPDARLSKSRPSAALQLIIATHLSLLQVDVAAGCVHLLASGQGHYYGVVPAGPLGLPADALLVGSKARLSTTSLGDQPAARNASFAQALVTADGRPADAILLHAAAISLGAWLLPTSYLHDLSRGEDGLLYVVDADTAAVHQLRAEPVNVTHEDTGERAASRPALAADGVLPTRRAPAVAHGKQPMQVRRLAGHGLRLTHVRRYETAEPGTSAAAAHANGALVVGGEIMVLHNNGGRRPSRVVVLDAASGRMRRTFELGGVNCHNLLLHRGRLLYLDSSVGGLGSIEPNGTASSSSLLWSAGAGFFSKGLAVVDDVAYFGVSAKTRRAAERTYVTCDLVAFDLEAGELLWRRPLPYGGLVNSISAPEVSPTACSSVACRK